MGRGNVYEIVQYMILIVYTERPLAPLVSPLSTRR